MILYMRQKMYENVYVNENVHEKRSLMSNVSAPMHEKMYENACG